MTAPMSFPGKFTPQCGVKDHDLDPSVMTCEPLLSRLGQSSASVPVGTTRPPTVPEPEFPFVGVAVAATVLVTVTDVGAQAPALPAEEPTGQFLW